LLFVGIIWGLQNSLLISRVSTISMFLTVMLLLFYRNNFEYSYIVIIALILNIVSVSYPKMFHKDISDIHFKSALIELVKNNLDQESKLAIVSSDIKVLPANLNATLGINTIHSYNSLSSRSYHHFIENLGGEMITYGRVNNYVLPDYDSNQFWMSNVGLVLSKSKISDINLDYVGLSEDYFLYKVKSKMGNVIRLALNDEIEFLDESININDIRYVSEKSIPKVIKDFDDLKEYQLNKTQSSSLLIVSQKYHKGWVGRAFISGEWQKVSSVLVNQVYQGFFVPKDTTKIEIKFKPYVRYSWIANIFWALVLVFSFTIHNKLFARKA
jgi:hypothetical protein